MHIYIYIPFPGAEAGSRESAYFLSVNRNKKSVCVDINTNHGQNIVKQLGASDREAKKYQSKKCSLS